MTLDELNAMPQDAAERALAKCCGSSRWAAAMAGRRRFKNDEAMYRVADEIWWSLEGADWLEAFSHHPRIGERSTGLAKDEQSGTRDASADTLQKLAERNHEYERKFGHVFLICATGKRADEMLGQLEQRMTNDPASELRVAAGEQAKITRLRLEKLLSTARQTSRTE
ncbi:MAG TPA: 2-oxo-4-hydroxy-4-carboxy-5-ureidoimidazoline decarboxylase [Gemmatimonadaceae bacterium]